MNNKDLILVFVNIFLLSTMSISLISAEEVVEKTSITITVPDDYLTIQQAIAAAKPGDTIFVRAGTYYGYINIYKPLTLHGEDKHTTIIDGQGTDWIIDIDSIWDVTFKGFTVKNSTKGVGISIEYQENAIIEDNIITCTGCAIAMYYCNNTKISDNIIQNNLCGIGIRRTSFTTFSGNVFKRNIVKAAFMDSSDNTWNNNYWNRPRVLPKLIFGIYSLFNKPIFIPRFNLDKNPSRSFSI